MESKYGMSWEEFKKKFEEGLMGDDADVDYIEWEATLTLIKELKEELEVLEDIVKH